MTHYDLDATIVRLSGATPAINNHVTAGWVAASDGKRGLLVAQSAEGATSMAFAYPHLLIPRAPWIAQPRTHRWPDGDDDRALIPARYQIGEAR